VGIDINIISKVKCIIKAPKLSSFNLSTAEDDKHEQDQESPQGEGSETESKDSE
jgi:hypothetical protein